MSDFIVEYKDYLDFVIKDSIPDVLSFVVFYGMIALFGILL